MKVYTKTGDDGTTALLGGARVSKAHIRIDAYGTVDELNAVIGMVRDHTQSEAYREILKTIQDRLFVIGADLATQPSKQGKVKKPDILETDIQFLEQGIDRMEDDLPPLQHFLLPGGHPAVSSCHLARCVCRRAERIVVLLDQQEAVEPLVLHYLNRLSDYLFVLSRALAKDFGAEEIKWEPRK